MSKRYWPLWGMFAFVVAVVLLIAWLALWGVGGEKRSLAFRNLTQGSITVRLETGQQATIDSDDTRAFSIEPEQFPQEIAVTDAEGREFVTERFTFEELKEEYEFRLLITPDGIITPVPPP